MSEAQTLAQAWQELLDAKFPGGVNVKNVAADGSLEPPVRNLPVLLVSEMHGDRPLLWGVPLEGVGLDLQIDVASWSELKRASGEYAVRVTQVKEGLPELVLEPVTETMAERMAGLRGEQREFLAAQIHAGSIARLAELRGVDPEQVTEEEVSAAASPLSAASEEVRLMLASPERH